jgi:hypothetical protein
MARSGRQLCRGVRSRRADGEAHRRGDRRRVDRARGPRSDPGARGVDREPQAAGHPHRAGQRGARSEPSHGGGGDDPREAAARSHGRDVRAASDVGDDDDGEAQALVGAQRPVDAEDAAADDVDDPVPGAPVADGDANPRFAGDDLERERELAGTRREWMGNRVLGILVCLALASGCSGLPLTSQQPGETMVTFPEPVAREYHCSKRRLPFFEVEKNELTPHRTRPGSRLDHSLVYVMCPSRISGVVSGKLYTRIHFKGKTVHTDVREQDLQPGRWQIKSFITLPEQADPGIYALEARFESPRGRFNVHSDFLVEP